MLFLKQNAKPIAIKANGVALTNNSEIPYVVEIGDTKKVCNAKNGLKPISEKIIEPVINVSIIAIIGTNIFIIFDDCDLETMVGNKLVIFSSH